MSDNRHYDNRRWSPARGIVSRSAWRIATLRSPGEVSVPPPSRWNTTPWPPEATLTTLDPQRARRSPVRSCWQEPGSRSPILVASEVLYREVAPRCSPYGVDRQRPRAQVGNQCRRDRTRVDRLLSAFTRIVAAYTLVRWGTDREDGLGRSEPKRTQPRREQWWAGPASASNPSRRMRRCSMW